MRTFFLLTVCIVGFASDVHPLRAAEQGAIVKTEACSFLTRADVDKVTRRPVLTGLTAMQLPNGAGILCDSNIARAIVFSGAKSEERWEDLLKGQGRETEERYPVPELGDRAYAVYPTPRNEYEYPTAIVVAPSERHTVVLSVRAPQGQSGQSVRPQAVELTNLVIVRLR